ncbi:hypothetical protein [Streptomyces sp. NBC_01237]|uniref:hypothetical protein n=1 Tax=Streptomyces sp. NBC_01237 TaxID=2903790 RepID=UPI002DDBB1F4|nr:hypothetical protein [Streptomyces sp. NBC_01237]WRZ76499.1 hypothetical protein OG251_35520 [Streptomyces sp. NBC_01237]
MAARAATTTPHKRRRGGTLRAVPDQAGPVTQLDLGNPLQLTETMRTRLLAAVRALVRDPARTTSDGARLAAVVLTAKARVRDDYRTAITTRELGRWLGLGRSQVGHTVLPQLRAAGLLGAKPSTSDFGRTTGLECWVVPMYRAQHAGDRQHVLALSRAELAVLLRLVEVLFGPGWTHRDGSVTPPGLLAGRTGRGAATDRLGLLLMVLSTSSQGWMRLCSGSVDTERGRPAVTVARLLGCSASAGAKVLARLGAQDGPVLVERLGTGSGLHGRSRVRIRPVAEAYGRFVMEARKASASVIADLPVTASGDHEPAEQSVTRVITEVPGAPEARTPGSPDLAGSAHLHSLHAPMAPPGGSLSLSGCFSGEGRGGDHRLPDRACEREDQAADGDAASRLTLIGSQGRPLRGEKPKKSPSSSSRKPSNRPVASTSARPMDGPGRNSQQRGRAAVRPSENLRAVLDPVQLLWARLDRQAARRLVEAATRSELARIVGFAGRTDAPKVLTARLTRRLGDQMRLGGPITDPVGWLIARGLPQRQQCADIRCDDGALLGSGRDCPRCADRQADRHAQRQAVAAAVETAMPHASGTERRKAAEQRLHETVTARGWAREHEREQVRARRAAAGDRTAAAAAAKPSQPDVAPSGAPTVPIVPFATHPAPVIPEAEVVDGDGDGDGDQELILEDLTREQVLDWRNRAAADHQLVHDHIDRYGEHSAQRLFTRAFVAQVQRISGLGHLNLGHTTWRQA